MRASFTTKRTAIAAVLSATLGLGGLMTMGAAHAAGTWVNTATQAVPMKNVLASPLAAQQQIHVVVGLKGRNKAQLDALVAAIGNPKSAQFGHTITAEQFNATYAPTASESQAVVSYLQSMGLTSIEVADNRLTVSAWGSAANVQKAFNTELVSFVSGGKTVYANRTAAQVPVALNGIVSAVLGLHSLDNMRTQIQHASATGAAKPNVVRAGSKPNVSPPDPGTLISTYSGPMYQAAYDAGSTPTGWGTTVGIIMQGDVSGVPADLRQYEHEFGLPQVPYEIVVTGLPSTDTAGIDEFDLDSQSSSGIAGNLKKSIWYVASTLTDPDLTMAYSKAISENRIKALNISIGGCESLEFLSGAMLVDDLIFEQGAVQGITVFTSSGDGGASCQLLINAGQPVVLSAVEYPASSPYVVSVGGTSLFTNADGSYNFETTWVSTGGGTSLWETAEPWQNGVVPLGGSPLAQRGIPDVAMVGDPNIGGAAVVVNGADTGVGGTSLSSPLSMGVWARMQTAHGNCLSFAAPIFYATYGQPTGTASLDLHDIVLGDNILFPALPGWDYTTGLGTFDIAVANAALPNVTCIPQVPTSLGGGAVNGQVLLSWGGSPGATSYAIYEGSSAGAEGATPVATTGNTSTVISNVVGGKTYYFTVKALNASGSSAASNELRVDVPVPPAPPVAPASSGASAQTAKGSIKVYWKASPGATGYEVFQGTAAGAESATPVATGITTASKVINGLSSGTKYYFYVKAVNANGESAKSPEASATAN